MDPGPPVGHTERAIAHLRSELRAYVDDADKACAVEGETSKACMVRVCRFFVLFLAT